jgi:hypothetical protein
MPSPRRSRAEWSQLVAAWRASGALSGDYARLHGLNHNTFVWWCSRFNREDASSPIRLVFNTCENWPLDARRNRPIS